MNDFISKGLQIWRSIALGEVDLGHLPVYSMCFIATLDKDEIELKDASLKLGTKVHTFNLSISYSKNVFCYYLYLIEVFARLLPVVCEHIWSLDVRLPKLPGILEISLIFTQYNYFIQTHS